MTESADDTYKSETSTQDFTDEETEQGTIEFNVEDFRQSISNSFLKSLFVGINNDTGENCFVTVVIQLLIHNHYIYRTAKTEQTIISKIIEKFEKLRTRSFLSFSEISCLFPNFDIGTFSNDPIIFFSSSLPYR